MAVKEFFHDIDLVKVGQLANARKQNLTTVQRNALAATLGPENEGLFVWDTTEKRGYTWDGTAFVGEAAAAPQNKTFFTTLNVTAVTPTTVAHNLALTDKDSFIARIADSTGSEISLDIDSVDVDSFTLRSLVALTGVKVTVVGF